MLKRLKRFCAIMIAATLAISNIASSIRVSAIDENSTEYEIYPRPQSIEYQGGEFLVGNNVNIIYESGIDIYTRDRVQEVLESHNISATISESVVEGMTNLLIGINESGEVVDEYFNENVNHDEAFFDNYDSNIVYVNEGVIGVLGNNTDSSFYGVTTLKHVFNQLEDNNEIENFRADDYADVANRGFIEGYYGNPWSNEDRAELMKFGGDYKMNQYIFAPKDDPYHNSKWRELYPEDALEGIKKLAQVGNETKNRYVYALHPFMYNPVRFNTEENYQADLDVIKAKFIQLLEADVRQFGILADDAGVPPQGPSTYVRLLDDLTEWLTQQQETYTDLKTDLVFCPNDYMGNGSSAQLKEVNKAGDNVNIVVTGGRIWGEVNQNFATNFINNIATEGNPGRAPYFWINWPCSDNSKQHLIMGGNDTFLHPGVDPATVKGIVLNPMQQAEANKSALFANADYAWNIWENKAQADQNWHDSFKYMDHGTAEETNASSSLREISKHMINQNMDGRVTALQESVELAPKLEAFKSKYENGELDLDAANELITEFTNLKNAAAYYKENPGNPRTRDQIIYWLNCWGDTMDAVIGYLNAAIAVDGGDNNEIWSEYSKGQAAFEKSKTYGFHYVDHTEYAEVGVQHIVPFIRFMEQEISNVVSSIVDPSKVVATYITNRTDNPTGSVGNILDNNPSTEIVYKSPNVIQEGTYVGVKYNTPVELKDVQFLMGAAANPNDTMSKGKIQYTEDGKTWVDLNDEVYTAPKDVKVEGLSLKVKGVRMIATETKQNTWLGVKDIVVNKKEEDTTAPINASVIRTEGWSVYSGSESNLLDNNDDSSVWYRTHAGDITRVGDYIGLDLGEVINVGKVHFVIGSDSADKWVDYKLEYSTDNENWTTYKEYTGKASGKDIIDEDFEGIEARYVRVTNLRQLNKWVKFSELKVEKHSSDLTNTENVYTNTDIEIRSIFSKSMTELVPKENITLNKGEYIGIKLDRIKDVNSISLNLSNMEELTLQSSMNGIEWIDVDHSNYQDARYVRIIASKTVNFDLVEFAVGSQELDPRSFVSAYAETHAGTDPMLALDGDFNTTVNFAGYQRKDGTIVYDLGQVINVDNVKYAVLDTDFDHIRDGKIQLSVDGESWVDAITIGDGVENGASDANAKPGDNGYKHGSVSNGTVPISHSYVEGTNLNQEARYVRVLFTANYNHRWTRISEIVINDGEYIPASNNPTFESNPIELKGFEPDKVRDGDLTTAYKPNTNNGKITSGSFTYRLSENTDVKKINIVQSGSSISNAKVMARTGYTESGEEIWNQLGILDKSLNEIINNKYKNIFEVKIEWEGIAPTIYELVTINNYEVVDAVELKNKYDELVVLNGDIYTIDSFKVLQDALVVAEGVLNNSNATQEEVDNALATLVVAEEGLLVKATEFKALESLISESNKLVESEYTPESWNEFANKLEIANSANANRENYTQEQIDTIVAELSDAKNSLVENVPGEIVVGKVRSLKATSTDSTVNLTWEAPASAFGLVEYVIYKDGKEVSRVSAEATEILVEDLRANTIYGFKVSAVYSNGEESRPVSINIRTKK